MLLGFKKRFKEPILNYTKAFTMRSKRKVQPKIGETLYMYTGLRTPHCELITNKEKLISIQKVRILLEFTKFNPICNIDIWVDGRKLDYRTEVHEFVKFDGFEDVIDFAEYWKMTSTKDDKKLRKEDLIIDGELQLFHWTDLKY